MPFTLAHAAAAFPLRRTRLILSALIIGTFTPDLEFFLRFAPKGPFGHTTRGLFLFCQPAGFIVFWLFHAVVKEPLAALMPRAVRQRVPADPYPLPLWQPLQLALVLVSILVGALTHVLWDSFTHAGYWPAQHWQFLNQPFTLPLLGVVHLYKLLQYASTVFGCLAVGWWFLHWMRTAPGAAGARWRARPADADPNSARFCDSGHCVAWSGRSASLVALGHPRSPRRIEIWIGEFVVTAISLAWLELMAWGLTLPLPVVRDASPQPADSD